MHACERSSQDITRNTVSLHPTPPTIPQLQNRSCLWNQNFRHGESCTSCPFTNSHFQTLTQSCFNCFVFLGTCRRHFHRHDSVAWSWWYHYCHGSSSLGIKIVRAVLWAVRRWWVLIDMLSDFRGVPAFFPFVEFLQAWDDSWDDPLDPVEHPISYSHTRWYTYVHEGGGSATICIHIH